MKKIKLLVISLLACVFSIAQQPSIGDIVRIDLPSSAHRLPHEVVKTVVDSTNYYLEFLKKTWRDASEFYMIDSFFLELGSAFLNLPKNYLEDTRKNFDYLSRKELSHYSEIKKINNYKVLVSSMDTRDWDCYFFFCVSDKSAAGITGRLDYSKSNKTNKKKALELLNEILDNLAFKQ